MTDDRTQQPNFRVTETKPHRVFLQCSKCLKDIKEIKPKETVDVTRAYWCDECEPNSAVIVLNPPVPKSKDGGGKP